MTKIADKPQVLLEHHLKALKLPTFLAEYEKIARESAAEGVDHTRYLLRLAELDDIASTVVKLWGVANSFGSVTFEWLCMATAILCFSANGTTRLAIVTVVEAVMTSAPNAFAALKPSSISSSVK